MLLSLLLACCWGTVVAAAEPTEVDFGKQIFPILQRTCIECHGSAKQEGGIRLDSAAAVSAAKIIAAGQPELSELIRRVRLPRNHAEIMPAVGEPLTADQIRHLERWIEQGAKWPSQFEPTKHWAYVPPVRPAIERLPEDTWSRNDLDRILLKQLNERRMRPATPADPEELIRRLYFDLIGLPPSPAEVNRFAVQPTDAAYAALVDELLGRPQFGERWARPWLDLARYADSHGFQRDDLRDIWAYRDWVIRALNQDMPFDQFTIEQLAGDLLPDATESQRIATGFHRNAPTNVEAGSLPEETRAEQLIDRVNTTAAVWLGTTLECAQCHDHKYDPFTSEDYYRLLAFFNHTALEADRTDPKQPSSIAFQGPSMPLANPQLDQQRASLQSQVEKLQRALESRRNELATDLADWTAQRKLAIHSSTQEHLLEIDDFQSLGNTDSYRKLEDGSILLVGDDPPEKDTYTLLARTSLSDIRAVRLEALTHESLPGTGPGRGDRQRANFVLNEFSVEVLGRMGDTTSLFFESATADFSQSKWSVAGAIDRQPATGWAIAPQFKKAHWAQFNLDRPLDASDGVQLKIRMDQLFGNARNLGRIRLWLLTGELDQPNRGKLQGLSEQIAKILATSPDNWSDAEREKILEWRATNDAKTQKLQKSLEPLKQQIDELAPDSTLVMVELDQPRMTYRFVRGDYRRPGEPVSAGTPSVLHPAPEGPANRLTLAKWLVDPANPLVARVVVNRWWAEIFGQGIVPTLEDFGIKGETPSYPELLDWLAVELMENRWSMKHLLRTIVLSSTYRQTSKATAEQIEADDANRWLARGSRFRLDAEAVRDNALAISGLLNLGQFGAPIRPPQPDGLWNKVGGKQYDYIVSPGSEKYRRGIYIVHKRSAPYPSFVNFDATSRLACTVKRSRTNTPLQALTLMNDPVYVECARELAKRALRELPQAALAERIEFAFQWCTSRRPRPSELQTLIDLYQTQWKAFQLRPDDCQMLVDQESLPAGVTAAELAAWYNVTTTLLNLHETITKR